MDQHPHRQKSVAGYLCSQLECDESSIDHVEQIQQQWIGQNEYRIWDCHTVDQGRWWVVEPFTNLYPQADFKSADYTLTFHIGLTESS